MFIQHLQKVGLLWCWCILLITACNNHHKINPAGDSLLQSATADTSSIFSVNVNAWVQNNLSLPQVDFHLEQRWQDDSLLISKHINTDSFIKNHYAMLRWSPDSTRILDFRLYHMLPTKWNNSKMTIAGESNTEVSLLNVANKEKTRLIFVDPSTQIIDAKWLDNNECIVLGIFKDQPAPADTLLWRINVDARAFSLYNVTTGNNK